MTATISRPPYDEDGFRIATCENCGMFWCEYREPVELLPGMWTGQGEKSHECPEALPYAMALAACRAAEACGGIVVSQRQKAAIRLGLRGHA